MSRLEQLVLRAAPRWLIDVASRMKAETRSRLARRQLAPLVAELFAEAEDHELLVANDDAAVVRVDLPDRSVILKVASSEVASEQLLVEAAALDELGQHDGLGPWRAQIAMVDRQGVHDNGRWFTQSLLPGAPTSKVALDAELLIAEVITALQPLHDATAMTVMADDRVLNDLVSGPVATISEWRPALRDDLTALNGECRQRLASLELTLSRQHGDYAPSNVLWDNETKTVSGIVDWKLAPSPLPPEVDYAHYALSLMMQRHRMEYGDAVIAMLGDGVAPTAAAPVRLAISYGPNSFDVRTAVTLAWLQHVSFGLHKAHDLRTNPIWLVNNIDAVVRALQSA